MAKRPAWSVQDDVVICENFDFMWSGVNIPVRRSRQSSVA